ncbi:hypothetical protein SAMN02787142_7643 [Burkholderia sp. WP9]|nr:hypothetical protein SAMN02787142_7643 [Burkholderia sp. WP9]
MTIKERIIDDVAGMSDHSMGEDSTGSANKSNELTEAGSNIHSLVHPAAGSPQRDLGILLMVQDRCVMYDGRLIYEATSCDEAILYRDRLYNLYY